MGRMAGEGWVNATGNGKQNAKETVLVMLWGIGYNECEKEYQKNWNYFRKSMIFTIKKKTSS